MKSGDVMRDAGPETPVHWDSRVDKFNKRLELVRKQFKDRPEERGRWESEVRDVSLYEFWWKYAVYRGALKRGSRAACIMVTPCYSADCANAEHASHERYARAAVIAYWRHMSTAKRHDMIAKEMAKGVKAVDRVYWGATKFEEESPHAAAPDLDRYLGVRDLFMKFEGTKHDSRGNDVGWGLALMEMLVDPLLSTWVPEWVVEQYERANPFFREVLRSMEPRDRKSVV